MIKEIDPIFKVKDEKELSEFLQNEKDDQEIFRLKKQKNPMSRVLLAHKFGEGDCNCSSCGN